MKKLFVLPLCIFAFSFLQIVTLKAQEEQLVSPAQSFSATLQPQMEVEVFNLINQIRVANFLPALIWS